MIKSPLLYSLTGLLLVTMVYSAGESDMNFFEPGRKDIYKLSAGEILYKERETVSYWELFTDRKYFEAASNTLKEPEIVIPEEESSECDIEHYVENWEPGNERWTQEGIASWYGSNFHGGPTASGETYDMYEMTAAHRELPFDTIVRVTRLDTNRSVVVRINNRGPFTGGRVIDLSMKAAKRLHMKEQGLCRVRVEVVKVP